ncbi:cobalamin biosynthesis protein CobG [Sphingomonas abaci]|uniref:Precorrin-3B synthase n=1 Tax=Sphingomonas abaci TaxID=237611 RepID=A0A7W7AJH6_9SPHN|nr:cobalamin biosynthesis protein CobG [Sphingomonas abaci]MBB4618172.1 precorrin-3B synthase [Sphingomonas abaci]
MIAQVKGWCPAAWRPMAAGDGLLVRVRPAFGRLSAAQALGLATAAARFGSGAIDLTRRASLQLRGVAEANWRPLVETLVALDLVDPDPAIDAQAGLTVAPDWQEGDDTHRIAADLHARRSDWPALPAKFGFAVDAGRACRLADTPADLRVERSAEGGLMLRAEGQATGVALARGEEAAAAIDLARWFRDTGGDASRRMARHPVPLPGWARGGVQPARGGPLAAGPHPLGSLYGLPFGRMSAAALGTLVARHAATALRLTPWRLLLVEGAEGMPVPGFGLDPADPLLAADACVGAPACPQASVATRELARRLAPHVADLHVSGCAKGCARSGPAALVLTGRDGRFDLARAARAGDPPAETGLDAATLLARFGAC